MTINLETGVTSSVWMSLKESVPIGYTGSYQFNLTNDITGATKSFTPTDQQPTNKWSIFYLSINQPENLAAGILDLADGMWSFDVIANSQKIESGKIMVKWSKNWQNIHRPGQKTGGAIRRN
jgi:hypothetical protein